MGILQIVENAKKEINMEVTVTGVGELGEVRRDGQGEAIFLSDTGRMQMPQPFTEMEEEYPRQRE